MRFIFLSVLLHPEKQKHKQPIVQRTNKCMWLTACSRPLPLTIQNDLWNMIQLLSLSCNIILKLVEPYNLKSNCATFRSDGPNGLIVQDMVNNSD